MISCVYKISNTVNSRIYIGSAKNFNSRKNKHLFQLKNNEHGNIKLQRFVNKYGIDKLIFDIVEKCTVDNLLIREQFYIDSLPSLRHSFNILPTAGSWLNRKHSKSAKNKMSKSKMGMQSSLGRKLSEHSKNLIRLKAIGRKQSDATINKRAMKNTGKSRPILAILNTISKTQKLSAEQIIEVRRLLSKGVRQADIGKQFGVCQRSISRIKQGISYLNIA
jgi:group I intron endonuclease